MKVEFSGTNAVKIFGKGLSIQSESDGVVIREDSGAAPAAKTENRGRKKKETPAAETSQTSFDPAKL